MIKIAVGGLESSRGHLYGIVQASDGERTIFADRLALDRAKDRRQFAEEVQRLAPSVDVDAIERELLGIVDRAAAEAGAAEAGLGGLMEMLTGAKQADMLVQLADEAELFHAAESDLYGTVPIDGHRETWALDSRPFKDWLRGRYYARHRTAPSDNAIRDAMGVIRSRAQFDSPERPVHVRIAGLGGAIYLDLGDEQWRAVEITPGGWRVIADPPVRFRRPRGLLALPEPTRGGNLDTLQRFINVRDADWRLLLSWLVSALRDRGPYVILLLYGQQGTAKSTTMRVLRALVDPNRSPIRSKPRDEDALLIAARSGAVVALDNVSHLSDEMSDALCRLATGGGIGKRQLYTDADEVLLDAMRPVMLNGIEELARRGDLADRSLGLELPPIPKRRRRDERQFWGDFETARPAIVGALLDAAVAALAREPEIHLDEMPRMADFAVWAAAAAPALGWTPEEFMVAYDANMRDRDQTVLDDSPLTRFVVELVDEQSEWTGTMSDLLEKLRDLADDRTLKDKRWPKDATRLSGMLRRLAPSLRATGIGVATSRAEDKSRARLVRLWRMPDPDGPGMDDPDSAASTDNLASAASNVSSDQIRNGARSVDAEPSRQRPQASAVTSAPAAPVALDAGVDAGRTLANGSSVHSLPDRADAADAADAEMQASSAQCGEEVIGHESFSAGAGAAGTSGRLGPGAPAPAPEPGDRLDAAVPSRQRRLSGTRPTAGPAQGESGPRGPAGGDGAPPFRHTVLTGAADARRTVADLATLAVLGLDTETTGLDPRSNRVRLVQLAAPDRRVYVFDLFHLDVGLLAPLFDPTEGPVLVGHNLRFDLGFLAAARLPVPNGGRLFDTMIAAHLLEDGADRFPAGHFSLAGVADRYLGVTLDKALQTSDWSGPLSDEQITYAARDAAVLPRLHAVMSERIAHDDLERVTRLEMRALPALVWLEQTGAPFDAEGWEALAEQAARRQVELEQALTQESGTMGPPDIFGETSATVNWGSPEQVKRVLANRGHAVERVDEGTLARLLDADPLAQLMLDYREAAKKVGTYGLDFLKHIHPATGRVHADWHQLGSRAGRMSCSKPNLQQVPRDRAYRACFRPAEGRALVKADFSQIELRIAAEIANDARLIEAYAAGEDVHMLTAAEVLGRRNGTVTKEDRQAAKALNFGLIYGAGGPTLRATAKTSYGVELSESDAMTFRRRFFDLYRGLKIWHRQQPGEERPVDTRTLAGRRRLGVTRFTEKLNSPVQGTGADGLKAALALLWETQDRCPGAVPVLVVHDEIVLECDAGDVEQAQAWLTDCMTRGMQSFLTRVPVVVEAAIERDWSGTPLSAESEQGAA